MPLNILEAINWALKEQFICTTPLSMKEFEARCQVAPPRAIAHWNFNSHKIIWTEIEDGLPNHDAKAFARHYAGSMGDSGWKMITED